MQPELSIFLKLIETYRVESEKILLHYKLCKDFYLFVNVKNIKMFICIVEKSNRRF